MMRSDLPFFVSGVMGLSCVSPALIQQCKEGYDRLDVRGKTVLDIGADWGNSVLYFWARGAVKVIAYESDWRKRISIRRLADRGVPVEVRGEWDDEYPKADVLKMDIESAEYKLRFPRLDAYPQWAVAIHELTFFMRISLMERGATMSHKQPGEEVWVKT